MPNETENRAVKFVVKFEQQQKRKVINVTRNNDFKGFDIISIGKGSDIKMIEVKGTTKKLAIPDAYESEFTRTKKLVATHLYVVSFYSNIPALYRVPRSAIKGEHLLEKRIYKFSSSFQRKELPKYKYKTSRNT